MDSGDLALSFGSALLTGPDDRAAKELTEHLIDYSEDIFDRVLAFRL